MGGTLFEGRDDDAYLAAVRGPGGEPPPERPVQAGRLGSVVRSVLAMSVVLAVTVGLAEWWSPGAVSSLRLPWSSSTPDFGGRASIAPLEVGNGQTAQEYLVAHGAPETLTVAWTEDPALNCGMEVEDGAEAGFVAYAAGCYQVGAHPDTVFVYWDAFSDVADRELLLLHEYAHYRQWEDESFAMSTLYRSGDATAEAAVEPDADCRAVALRGEGSPRFTCEVPEWSEGWLAQQAAGG